MALMDFFIPIIVFIAAWEMVWKGIALWKCGKNKQLVWYILIFVLNTAGILPIIYLMLFRKNKR